MSDDPKDTTLEDRMTSGFILSAGGKVVHDGELLSMLERSAAKYNKQFGQKLEVEKLPDDQWEAANELLLEAMRDGVSFTDQKEFEGAVRDATS